ncbi:MAG: tRNA guanosine(34) transglycosylase Tgt [Vicinamibacteria bacterium]|jgi:queuine tRNA-ribosyltransferase|nr:tRNA guanosine(34) transglycosylase Tgt [Vicinamibacteria bacterium]
MFSFELQAKSDSARAGLIVTPHGAIATPVFMPVGTAGTVKAVTQKDLLEIGTQIQLANTYHLILRPGDQHIATMGGLHGFTGWQRPFLTDSGGYQVFSLSDLRNLTEEGVLFRSHIDGAQHMLSPERSIEAQMNLGADIIMAFDECPPYPADRDVVSSATDRTTRWARRSRDAHRRDDQWLFGIIQGGVFADLRERSAREIMRCDFPGYAIGGLSVGEPKDERERVLRGVCPGLPDNKPRYLMGVGTIEDIFAAIACGVDMFDCVLPTRNGRNGQLFTSRGRLSIRNARYRQDATPPDPRCSCYTCRSFSRAYLRHLHMVGEITASILITIHNLAFYLDTLVKIRQSILLGRFKEFHEEFLSGLSESASASSFSGNIVA